MNITFNRVLRFVAPMFDTVREIDLYPANNATTQIAAQSWVASTRTAPYRTSGYGLMDAQLQGDLITVQRIISGVNPIDAAMNAQMKAASGNIQ